MEIMSNLSMKPTPLTGTNLGNEERSLEREIESLSPLMHSLRGRLMLYTFRGAESPRLMCEVGRLREQAFRASGGGTGRDLDIDDEDWNRGGYRQLVVWDAAHRRILGGYRYAVGSECDTGCISSARYFAFSPHFRRCYLPYAIELGRSFTVRDETVRSLFAMDALWQGLGRIVTSHHRVRYLFGKVTIYPNYDGEARRLLTLFLEKFFPARQPLMQALYPFVANRGEDPFCRASYAENYALLVELLRCRGERIPPMIHAYMRLTRSMEVFGSVVNRDFGGVVETAILLPIAKIVSSKRERYFRGEG